MGRKRGAEKVRIRFETVHRAGEFTMSALECHDFYELYFLRKGVRRVVLEGSVTQVCAPALVILPPWVMHRTEGGAYIRTNVDVSDGILSHLPFFEKQDKTRATAYQIDNNTFQIIEELLIAGEKTGQQETENRIAYLRVIGCFLQESERLAGASCAPVLPEDTQIAQVVNYINEHYGEKLRVENLCRIFYMTKSSLSRRFRRATHTTLNVYIGMVRMKNAEHLLLKTQLSVEEIAARCGFTSLNYFSQSFCRRVGLSPSAYRKAR